MTNKTIPLFAKILIGMLAGIVVGFVLLQFGFSLFVNDWIKPWGTIFIRLLKLIAIPLVFVSLVKVIAGMRDLKQLSRLGIRTLSLYLAST